MTLAVCLRLMLLESSRCGRWFRGLQRVLAEVVEVVGEQDQLQGACR